MSGNQDRGFTLIELLIVIAVIGLLSTIITVAMGSARLKARDSKRMADLKQIQTALELYYNDHEAYPAGTNINIGSALSNTECLDGNGFVASSACGTGQKYMASVPTDPVAGRYYVYSVSTTDYTVTAQLEGQSGGYSGTIQLKSSGISQ